MHVYIPGALNQLEIFPSGKVICRRSEERRARDGVNKRNPPKTHFKKGGPNLDKEP